VRSPVLVSIKNRRYSAFEHDKEFIEALLRYMYCTVRVLEIAHLNGAIVIPHRFSGVSCGTVAMNKSRRLYETAALCHKNTGTDNKKYYTVIVFITRRMAFTANDTLPFQKVW